MLIGRTNSIHILFSYLVTSLVGAAGSDVRHVEKLCEVKIGGFVGASSGLKSNGDVVDSE